MGVVTKLTSKYQTTIPVEIRRRLGLEEGDLVEFVVEGNAVSLKKAHPQIDDSVAFKLTQNHAMRDWDTPEDDEAFRDL
jgi:antitoxin PrlF